MATTGPLHYADAGLSIARLLAEDGGAAPVLVLTGTAPSEQLCMRTAQWLITTAGALVCDDPQPFQQALRRYAAVSVVTSQPVSATQPGDQPTFIYLRNTLAWQSLLRDHPCVVIDPTGSLAEGWTEEGKQALFWCCANTAALDALPPPLRQHAVIPHHLEERFTPYLPVSLRSHQPLFCDDPGLLACGPWLPPCQSELSVEGILETLLAGAGIEAPLLPGPRDILAAYRAQLGEEEAPGLFGVVQSAEAFAEAESLLQPSTRRSDIALEQWRAGRFVATAEALPKAELNDGTWLELASSCATVISQLEKDSPLRTRLITATVKRITVAPEAAHQRRMLGTHLLEYADHQAADVFAASYAGTRRESAEKALAAYRRAGDLLIEVPARLGLVMELLRGLLQRDVDNDEPPLSNDNILMAASLNNRARSLAPNEASTALREAKGLLRGDDAPAHLRLLIDANAALLAAHHGTQRTEALTQVEQACSELSTATPAFAQPAFAPLLQALSFATTRLQAELDMLDNARHSLSRIQMKLAPADRSTLEQAIAASIERHISRAAEADKADEVLTHYATLKQYQSEQSAELRHVVANALAGLGRHFNANGQRSEAFTAFHQLVDEFNPYRGGELDPYLSEAWHHMSRHHASSGESDAELACYEALIRGFINNTSPEIQERVLFALRNHSYQMVHRAKQSLHSAKFDAGMQQLMAAESSLQGVIQREGSQPHHLANLGYIQYLLQQPRQAKMTLLRAILEGGEKMREVALEFEEVIPLAEDRYFRRFLDKLQRPDFSMPKER